MKKRMRTLAIIFLICMITVYPVFIKRQRIQGIVADSQGNLAVAVRSVSSDEAAYLYIYSRENKLQKIVMLPNFKGGIDAIREENDRIGIYRESFRHEYDFNGEYLIKESYDGEIPQSLFECSSGDDKYVYSQNLIGFEKVTKYTADGKSKTVFSGISLYIKKLLFGFIPTAVPIAVLYTIIYHDAKYSYSREELQEINAKLREKITEKNEDRKKKL